MKDKKAGHEEMDCRTEIHQMVHHVRPSPRKAVQMSIKHTVQALQTQHVDEAVAHIIIYGDHLSLRIVGSSLSLTYLCAAPRP